MNRNAIRASLGLWLLSAPILASAQEPTVYKLPPPRVTCDAASGLRDQAGNVVPGALRKQCDVLWNRSLQDGGVGGWRYDDFISQCAQSCPAPAPLSQASSVPQLNTLGTQAAQSASGGGFNTALLVGGGVEVAVGVGLAVSGGSPGPNDQPASP